MSSKFAKYSASSSSCEQIVKIGYATDVEGNYDYWCRYIDLSEILNRNSGGQLELSPDCHFVFGGDVVDRGPGDLRVLSDLVNLRRSYPDRVHFIMGNRDINKMRIPIELHPSIIKIPPKVFWLKENELCAADSALVQTPAEKLKWMLTRTMGSPLAFEYRREELRMIGGDYGDQDIADSYLDIMKPGGLMTEYLLSAKIAIIIGDVLIIHGALHTYNMGWIPPVCSFSSPSPKNAERGEQNTEIWDVFDPKFPPTPEASGAVTEEGEEKHSAVEVEVVRPAESVNSLREDFYANPLFNIANARQNYEAAPSSSAPTYSSTSFSPSFGTIADASQTLSASTAATAIAHATPSPLPWPSAYTDGMGSRSGTGSGSGMGSSSGTGTDCGSSAVTRVGSGSGIGSGSVIGSGSIATSGIGSSSVTEPVSESGSGECSVKRSDSPRFKSSASVPRNPSKESMKAQQAICDVREILKKLSTDTSLGSGAGKGGLELGYDDIDNDDEEQQILVENEDAQDEQEVGENRGYHVISQWGSESDPKSAQIIPCESEGSGSSTTNDFSTSPTTSAFGSASSAQRDVLADGTHQSSNSNSDGDGDDDAILGARVRIHPASYVRSDQSATPATDIANTPFSPSVSASPLQILRYSTPGYGPIYRSHKQPLSPPLTTSSDPTPIFTSVVTPMITPVMKEDKDEDEKERDVAESESASVSTSVIPIPIPIAIPKNEAKRNVSISSSSGNSLSEQADKFPEEVSPTNRFTFPRKKTGKFRRFSCTSSTQQGSGLGAGNSGNQQGTPGGPVKEKGLGIREEFKGSGSGSEKRASSTMSRAGLLCLRQWVQAINAFAAEEMNDFVEHIEAYIAFATSSTASSSNSSFSTATSISTSLPSPSSSGNTASDNPLDTEGGVGTGTGVGTGVGAVGGNGDQSFQEGLSWSSVGGYDHPQPGSRLLQYAMGWMPDKSVNPSTIYANHLMSNNSSDPNCQGMEPSVEVAEYLKEAHINKIIVGHQPRGDAPLLIDLGTGIQIISADTSYAANTLWDLTGTDSWSSLPHKNAYTIKSHDISRSYSVSSNTSYTISPNRTILTTLSQTNIRCGSNTGTHTPKEREREREREREKERVTEIVEKDKEKEKVEENENEGEGEGEKNDASHDRVGSDQDVMMKGNEGEKSLDEKKDEEIEEKDLERTTDEDVIAARTLSKSNMEELVTCYFSVLNTERPSPPIAISPYASISRMGSNSNTRCPTRSGSGSALDGGLRDLHAFGRRSAKCVDNNAVDTDGVDIEKESSWRRHSIVLDYAPTPRPASPSPSSPPSSLPNSRAGREEVKCPVKALSGSEKDSGFASGADEICSKLEAIKIKSDSYDLRRLNGEKEKEQEQAETKTNEIGGEKQNGKFSNEDMEKEKVTEKEKEKEKERDKGDKMKWNPTALLSNAPIPHLLWKLGPPQRENSRGIAVSEVLLFMPLSAFQASGSNLSSRKRDHGAEMSGDEEGDRDSVQMNARKGSSHDGSVFSSTSSRPSSSFESNEGSSINTADEREREREREREIEKEIEREIEEREKELEREKEEDKDKDDGKQNNASYRKGQKVTENLNLLSRAAFWLSRDNSTLGTLCANLNSEAVAKKGSTEYPLIRGRSNSTSSRVFAQRSESTSSATVANTATCRDTHTDISASDTITSLRISSDTSLLTLDNRHPPLGIKPSSATQSLSPYILPPFTSQSNEYDPQPIEQETQTDALETKRLSRTRVVNFSMHFLSPLLEPGRRPSSFSHTQSHALAQSSTSTSSSSTPFLARGRHSPSYRPAHMPSLHLSSLFRAVSEDDSGGGLERERALKRNNSKRSQTKRPDNVPLLLLERVPEAHPPLNRLPSSSVNWSQNIRLPLSTSLSTRNSFTSLSNAYVAPYCSSNMNSGRTSAKVSGRKGSVGNTQSSPSLTKNPVSSPLLSRSAPGSFMLSVQPLHSLSLSLIQNHAISSSYSSRGSRSQGTHEHAVYPSPAPALSKVCIHGVLSQGTEYHYELPPANKNRLLGRRTHDGWFVKATGIQLSAEAILEVLKSSHNGSMVDDEIDQESEGERERERERERREDMRDNENEESVEGNQIGGTSLERITENENLEVVDYFTDIPFFDYDGDIDESSEEEKEGGMRNEEGEGEEDVYENNDDDDDCCDEEFINTPKAGMSSREGDMVGEKERGGARVPLFFPPTRTTSETGQAQGDGGSHGQVYVDRSTRTFCNSSSDCSEGSRSNGSNSRNGSNFNSNSNTNTNTNSSTSSVDHHRLSQGTGSSISNGSHSNSSSASNDSPKPDSPIRLRHIRMRRDEGDVQEEEDEGDVQEEEEEVGEAEGEREGEDVHHLTRAINKLSVILERDRGDQNMEEGNDRGGERESSGEAEKGRVENRGQGFEKVGVNAVESRGGKVEGDGGEGKGGRERETAQRSRSTSIDACNTKAQVMELNKGRERSRRAAEGNAASNQRIRSRSRSRNRFDLKADACWRLGSVKDSRASSKMFNASGSLRNPKYTSLSTSISESGGRDSNYTVTGSNYPAIPVIYLLSQSQGFTVKNKFVSEEQLIRLLLESHLGDGA